MSSLCSPTDEFSCFACCPPIRPAHYDHLDYRGSLKRELSENRLRYFKEGPLHRPIVGFSCWALGFLDTHGGRVGCLLHPGRNQGRDLRGMVDYGNKCRRESCIPAQVFSMLPSRSQDFWLSLVEGFDSFQFSSHRANPLFHILLWGKEVLEHLHLQALEEGRSANDLLCNCSFITGSDWNPRAHRFLFRLVFERKTSAKQSSGEVESYCRHLWLRLLDHPTTRITPPTTDQSMFTHLLPLDNDFLDFIRLGFGWEKTSLVNALEIKQAVLELVDDTSWR